jgi:predicted DNA-binding transcriptional regulator AlpA
MTASIIPPPEYLIRKRDLLKMIGVNASTLDEWIKAKTFPAPIILNPGAGREIIAWRLRDVLAWIESRPQRQAQVISLAPYQQKGRRRKRKPPPITPPPEE